MRSIMDHKVSGLNEHIEVNAMDAPGDGGANHLYEITLNGSLVCTVKFQKGPILEAGMNGITNEALLAVVIDRLRGFTKGQFSCKETEMALHHTEEALSWLRQRTLERINRGVEGKRVK